MKAIIKTFLLLFLIPASLYSEWTDLEKRIIVLLSFSIIDAENVNSVQISLEQNKSEFLNFITKPDSKITTSIARTNAIFFLNRWVSSGVMTYQDFFNIILSLKQNPSLFFPSDRCDSMSFFLSKTIIDSNNRQNFSIDENFNNAMIIVGILEMKNFFQGSNGLSNSILKKLEAAKKDISKLNQNPAINVLTATLNEISAQKGGNITEDGATILTGYINNLIVAINKEFQNKKDAKK